MNRRRRPGPEQVSLAQLFEENQQQPPERPRRGLPWWLTTAALALAVAGGLYAVLRVFGLLVPYSVLAGAVLTGMLLRRVLKQLPPAEPPAALRSPAWGVTDDDPDHAPVVLDGLVNAVKRWEARFSWTERDHVRFAQSVLPRLRELVEERLRQRHGVTLRADPDRARALIGPALWGFLHEPVRRNPTPREVADIVTQMEKI